MTLEQILERLRHDPNVAHWHTLEAADGVYADFPASLDPRLAEAAKRRGIRRLYRHQADSVEQVAVGRNVVVVTPTASGKTLCYNLPVLNAVLADPSARALYLFPTKALAQDQKSELLGWIEALEADIKAHTFDGDTPAMARRAVRISGHVVVTNPDMLHTGILPHHTKWVKLFENLRFVVIDELHHYRGVFGSHLGNVIRRLLRIARFYNADPQFIACSATIHNPGELAERIVGRPFTVIDQSGAPTAQKHVIFYNPPVVNEPLGIRRSSLSVANQLAATFLTNQVSTIVFARMRRSVEVILTYLREHLRREKQDPNLVEGYRGGYLPNERRSIERGLREGSIRGVVSTNALELGVDVGALDVAILTGYPGTVASLWQQIGRAGRRSGLSAAILVANSSPIDQFLMRNPEYLIGRSVESGIIDPTNLVVLMSHLKCAAFELPFSEDDKFGVDHTLPMLQYLEQNRVLTRSAGRFFWASEVYPAAEVSLRSASPENFVIHNSSDGNKIIGEVDYFSAPVFLHPEAIYLHGAEQYQVEELDWDGRRAYVKSVDVEYFTDAETKTDLKILTVDKDRRTPDARLSCGEVALTTVAVLYKKIRFHTHENVGSGQIRLPELEMHTTAFWIEFPENVLERLDLPIGQTGSVLHAAANALGQMAPLWVMADPRDVGALSQVRSPRSGLPTLYLYDNIPGGVGFSQRIYEMAGQLFTETANMIAACPCRSGCPSCVAPEMAVGATGKRGAEALLRFAAATADLSLDPIIDQPVAELAADEGGMD
ncbi:MAG TPA: DEAD/DEAH box helicase [candidate division Zixibacteria bacterium]|jgi:DEAD/DEAH box helicase domain-containing protein